MVKRTAKSPSNFGQKRPAILAASIAALLVVAGGMSAHAQLTIDPTFDNSIKSLSDATQVEAGIYNAISEVESDITTAHGPVTVSIYFQNVSSGLGASVSPHGTLSLTQYIADLQSNPNINALQLSALATMPTGPIASLNNNTTVTLTAANLAAIGESALAASVVAGNGGYDSTISLNLSNMNASRSTGMVITQYDLQATANHEIDEALGIGGDGSTLADGSGTGTPVPTSLGPLDFFRYSAPGVRSFTYDNSTTAYFSIDGGNTNLVYFNQQGGHTATAGSDYADWGAPPGNAIGESHGNNPPLVQDAFGASYPAVSPNLSTQELTALQVVGYNLVHSPLYWTGSINGAWTLQNWASDAAGTYTPSIPASGNDVFFSATGAVNQTNTTLIQNFAIHNLTVTDPVPVVINSGAGGPYTLAVAGGILVGSGSNLTINSNVTLSGSADTIEVDGFGVVAINGVLDGGEGLFKIGTGTLTLSGANIYTAPTCINAGILNINSVDISTNPQPLGEGNAVNLGATVTSSGTLNYTGSGGTLDKAINVVGNGYDTVQNSGTGPLTLSGTVTIKSTALNFNDNGSGLIVTGAIGEDTGMNIPSSTVNINGGSVSLNGANTYTGQTRINAGTLNINTVATGATAQSLGEYGQFSLGVAGTSSGTLDYTGTGGTLDKVIVVRGNGGDTIQNSGSGLLTLSGFVDISGTALNGTVLNLNGGSGGITISSQIQGVNPGSSLNVTGGTVTLSNPDTVDNGASPNFWTGPTAISGGGTLKIAANDELPYGQINFGGPTLNAGNVVLDSGATNAGTLDLNGYDQTLNGLEGDGANAVPGQVVNNGGGAHTLTIGASDVSSIFDGLIKDNTNGSGGTITLVKTGAGSLVLGGANTFTGATHIDAGFLFVSAVATGTAPQPLGENKNVFLGNNASFSESSGELIYTGTVAGTLDKIISAEGTGGDTIGNLGSGSLTLTGSIHLIADTAAGDYPPQGGISFSDNGSGIAVLGVIDDGGSGLAVTVLAGNVTFSGANTYGGPTQINAGTLNINTVDPGNGAQSLGMDHLVNLGVANTSSGTLNYTGAGGTLNKNIYALGNGGDTIQNSGGGPLTLAGDFSLVTIYSTALNFNDNGSGIVVNCVIAESGTPGSMVNILGGTVTLGKDNTFTGPTSVEAGTVNINSVATGATAQPLGEAPDVNLGVPGTSSGILNYTGTGGTLDKDINVLGKGGDTIQNSGSGPLILSGTVGILNTTLNFNDNGSGTNVTGAILALGNGADTIQNNGSGQITLSGTVAIYGPAINFNDNGSGILVSGVIGESGSPGSSVNVVGGVVTLSNANTYTGTTNVEAGQLNFSTMAAGAAAQPLGEASAVNLGVAGTSSGILNYIGSGGTLDKAINVLGVGNDTIENSGTGLLTVSGNVTIYGTALTLSINGSGINVTGPIQDGSSSGGGLNVIGARGGVATLSNVSTYTGPTNIFAGHALDGVLQAGSTTGFSPYSAFILVNPGVVLDLNGYSNTIGSLANGFPGSGTVTNNGGNPATLTTGNDGTSTTYSGIIQDGASQLSLVKIGDGAQTLSGLNTYTGQTSINAGTLAITAVNISTNPQPLGENNTVNLGVANTSSGTLNYTGTNGTLDKNFNVLGNGGDTIQNSGTGRLTLSGNLTIHGTTLNFSDNGYSILVTGQIGESGAPGSAVTIQSGIVGLYGTNTYTGATNVSAGATLEASVASLGQTSMINLGSAPGPQYLFNGYGSLYTVNGGSLNKNVNDLWFGQVVATGATPLNLTGTVTIGTDGLLELDSALTGSRNPGGGLIVSGLIQGQASVQTIVGSVTLTNNNTFSGGVYASGGTVNFSTMAAGAAAQPLGESSAVNLGVNSNNTPGTLNYNGNGGTLDKEIFISSAGIIQNSGSGPLNLTGNLESFDGGTLFFNDNGSGIAVQGVVGVGGLTVLGGVVTLTNANTYTGAITINAGGTLNLGGGGASGSLNPSSSLILNGGAFSYNVTGGPTQAFAGLTINSGASSIAVAAGNAVDLRFADIARFLGGTVDFSGPGTVWANTLTNGNNNVVVDDNGTAYATVNGVDWATNNPGTTAIGALSATGAYQTGTGSYISGNDIDVGASIAGTTDAPAANFIVNTLRFNASGLTLALTGAFNTVSTGGILVTNAGISDTISGGIIQSELGREMVIINNGSLNVSAVIADSSSGSSALTISGVGKLTLSGQNTYTGVTTLNSGVVNLASAENPGVSGPLGNSPASNPGSIAFNGGTLQYSAANQNDYSGRFSTAPNQSISIDTNGQTVTFATPLTSPGGGLTLSDSNFGSPGTLILTGQNTYNGPTTINGGTLVIGGVMVGNEVTYGSISLDSPLVLGGGALRFTFAAETFQPFNGTTINQGTSAVTAGIRDFVYFGAITRHVGGTVDFNSSDFDVPATFAGNAPVSGVNNVLVSANGTAFATVNGTDWATSTLLGNSPGSLDVFNGIGALSVTGAYQIGVGSYVEGSDIDVGASAANTTDAPAANFTINTLRFNASGLTLALALTGSSTVSTGGILVTSAGTSDTISGGILRPGGGREMVIINNGSLAISSSIADSMSGRSALTVSGVGTLSLSGQNTYTGVTRLNSGIVNLGSAEHPGVSGPLGASPASNPGSIVFNGGTLQYSTANQNDYSGRFSNAPNQRYSIDTNGQSVTFATPLTSPGGSLTLADSNFASPGTLMLTAANTYTGPTTVNAGTLDIGGAGATGSISSSSPLVLGGGTLAYTETGNATQSFNGATINSGASAVTAAAGDTVNLIAITRNIGGTVDFNGLGAVAVNASVSGVNNVLVSASGTAFATVNGIDWATSNGGSVGALSNTGTYQTGAGSYVAGNDIDVGASNGYATDTPAANFTVNTLRFNAARLTLALSGTNTVSTGGILVTSAGSNVAISGGAIRSGVGQEMVIINHGSLNISSVIADSISGPSALTASGGGTLTLSGQNTYTGVTTLNGGIVNLGSTENAGVSGPLGNSAASNPGSIVFNGGTLQYSQYNNNDYSGRFSTAPNQRFIIDANGQSVFFATALSSNGGSLTLTNSLFGSFGSLFLFAANTYTGVTSINAGTLIVDTVATGATAQSLGEGTTVNLGVANTSSGTLDYVGGSGTLDKTINVLGNGNDSIANYGGTLTLSGHVTIYGTTLNLNDYGGNGINVTGAIGESGAPGSLNVVGGVVTLSNTNTYTGATTVFGGMLQFARETSLYNNNQGRWTAANLTVWNGATLALNVGGPGEFTSADVAAISALGSNRGGFQAGSILGLDTTNAPGGNFVYNGVIADTNGGVSSLGLTKLGAGTLTLTSANTYTGPTTVVAGILALTGNGTLGSGPLDIAGGSLSANSVAAIAVVSSITIGSDATTGTLALPGGSTLNLNVTVGGAGGGVIENTGGGTLTLTGTLTKDGNVLTLSGGTINVAGPIVGASPGSDLVVNQSAVVTLTNANNSYNGPTYVNGGAMLRNGVANALPAGTALTLGEATSNTGGTYDLNGFDVTIAGLSSAGQGLNTVTNSGAGGTNTLTVTGSGTFGGTIQDGGNAKTALTKSGSGAQTLIGTNTYTGATIVNGGTLLVSGSIAGSTTTVSGTGTLGGSGGTTGAVIVNSGGTLAPGTRTCIGTLNTGTLTLNSDATFHLTLDTSTGTASQVVATGDLSLDPASILTLTDLGSDATLAVGTTLPFLDYTGTWNGGTFAGYAEDSTFTFGANSFQITYDGLDASNGDRAVTLIATPELGSSGLVIFGALLLGGWRRREKSN